MLFPFCQQFILSIFCTTAVQLYAFLLIAEHGHTNPIRHLILPIYSPIVTNHSLISNALCCLHLICSSIYIFAVAQVIPFSTSWQLHDTPQTTPIYIEKTKKIYIQKTKSCIRHFLKVFTIWSGSITMNAFFLTPLPPSSTVHTHCSMQPRKHPSILLCSSHLIHWYCSYKANCRYKGIHTNFKFKLQISLHVTQIRNIHQTNQFFSNPYYSHLHMTFIFRYSLA